MAPGSRTAGLLASQGQALGGLPPDPWHTGECRGRVHTPRCPWRGEAGLLQQVTPQGSLTHPRTKYRVGLELGKLPQHCRLGLQGGEGLPCPGRAQHWAWTGVYKPPRPHGSPEMSPEVEQRGGVCSGVRLEREAKLLIRRHSVGMVPGG